MLVIALIHVSLHSGFMLHSPGTSVSVLGQQIHKCMGDSRLLPALQECGGDTEGLCMHSNGYVHTFIRTESILMSHF